MTPSPQAAASMTAEEAAKEFFEQWRPRMAWAPRDIIKPLAVFLTTRDAEVRRKALEEAAQLVEDGRWEKAGNYVVAAKIRSLSPAPQEADTP